MTLYTFARRNLFTPSPTTFSFLRPPLVERLDLRPPQGSFRSMLVRKLILFQLLLLYYYNIAVTRRREGNNCPPHICTTAH